MKDSKVLPHLSITEINQSLIGRDISSVQTPETTLLLLNKLKVSSMTPTAEICQIEPLPTPSNEKVTESIEAPDVPKKLEPMSEHHKPLRRSTRERAPRQVISLSMSGKSHGTTSLSLLSDVIRDPPCYSESTGREGEGEINNTKCNYLTK